MITKEKKQSTSRGRLSVQRLYAVMLRWLSVVMISAIAYSCAKQSPEESEINMQSEKYRQTVGDFYTSLAAIQSDQALFAVEKMQDVSEMYPEEPAVWANLGVFAMRQGNFELAKIGRAHV